MGQREGASFARSGAQRLLMPPANASVDFHLILLCFSALCSNTSVALYARASPSAGFSFGRVGFHFFFFFFFLLPFFETPCCLFWRRSWVLLAPCSRGSVPLPQGRQVRGYRGAPCRRRLAGKDVGNGIAVSVCDRGVGNERLFFSFIIFIFSAAMAGKECSLKFPIGVPPRRVRRR